MGGYAGDTVSVTVQMANNPGLAGWVVKVDFDESALELLSYAAGDTFPTDKISYGPTRNPASALFADFTSPDVTTNGVLFTLTFRVKEDAPIGATVLHLYTNDPDNFSTGDFLAVPVFFMDTTVNIQEHIHTYDNACDP